MRARDGGVAESSIVLRRKVKPEESKEFDKSVGHDTPSVTATASPAQWQEPNWFELPDLDLPSPPYCILFVGPNNSATAKLSLEEEFRKARDAFSFRRGSDFWSQRVMFERLFFASKNDLAQGLLKHNPIILHFACHGQKSALELFQGDLGADDLVQAMAGWSSVDNKNNLHLVVANACNSSHFARSLSQHADFVIGHDQPVEDRIAIDFAESLYLGLGAEQSLLESFSLARLNSPLYCMTGQKNAANFILKAGQLTADAGCSVAKYAGRGLPEQDMAWASMPASSDVRVMISDEPDQAVEFIHVDMPYESVVKLSGQALNCIALDLTHLTSSCPITGSDMALCESAALRSNAQQDPRRGVCRLRVMRILTHTRALTIAHAHSHKHKRSPSLTHIHTLVPTRTHMNAQTHTHTHTRARTHTRTLSQSCTHAQISKVCLDDSRGAEYS